MSKAYQDDEIEVYDKYERLEALLRQTLTLAGEITDDKGRPLPGECIIVRRRSNSDPTGASRQDIRRSLLKRRKAFNIDESEDSQSQSPASSVQEPFSPASLAVSLDAVVEKGKTSDDDLCVLDTGSAASVTARFAEPPSNRSSLLTMDDGQHGLAAQTPLPQLLPNENVPKRLQRPSLPQRNTSMIVHSGQESLVEASMEPYAPEKIVENPRNDLLERRRTPAHGSLLGSPACSRTSPSNRNSDVAPKRPQQIEEERRKGDITAANQSPPPKWQVKVLPVASAQDLGSPTPSSPALMKIEAVFPLKTTTEGNATYPLAYNSEPSYIIIGRPSMGSSPESPRPRADEDVSDAHEKSLQKFIDEWEYDAEAPAVEERRL